MAALEIRGQGFKDGAEDVRGFRRAILEGKVTPKPTKLLRYAMGEARVLMDPAGNAKLAKRAEGGRRSTARGRCGRRRDPGRCGGRSAAYGAAETVAL